MERPTTDQKHVQGLAKGIIEELVRANVTMHEMQVAQWARMAAHPPRGEHLPKDIMKGFGRDQFLSLKSAELTVYLKPSQPGFLARLRMGLSIIAGRRPAHDNRPFKYELCQPGDEEAVELKLLVEKQEDGKIKASYQPADEETKTLMGQ